MRRKKIDLKSLKDLVWGLFFCAFAVVLYSELDKIEATGGSARVPSIIATAYRMGGKWGAVAIFVFLGGVCFWSVLNRLRVESGGDR